MLDEEIISAQSGNEATSSNAIPINLADTILSDEYIISATRSNEASNLKAVPIKNERSDGNYWLIMEQKGKFEKMQESYISECHKMGKELDFLIAHYRIVGNRKNIIEASEELKKDLLDTTSFRLLEDALCTTSEKRTQVALQNVQDYLTRVSVRVANFLRNLVGQRDVSHLLNVSRWMEYTDAGSEVQRKITGFLADMDLVACLKCLHNEVFKRLEELMRVVTDELSIMERNSVCSWLTSEKMGASRDTNGFEQWYKKYTTHVRSFKSPATADVSWSTQEVEVFKKRCTKHNVACTGMDEELRLLIGHYEHIGGDNAVITASRFLREKLLAPMKTIEWFLSEDSPDMEIVRESLLSGVDNFGWLHFSAYLFQHSLYLQKHAFYFHNVEKWVEILWIEWRKMIVLIEEHKLSRCRDNIKEMLDSLEKIMDDIVKDLQNFRKQTLPSFLTELKERDTNQYTNITAIATFFSSVTATTLQLSYSTSSSKLLAVINLFWFLSLVFSVSAGVSSLLGLMWRKSPIYYTSTTPKPIRMWLEKAPIVFLIISALIFIVGLNLLAWVRPQSRFEAIVTVVFTGAHISGLLVVIYWFFLESEQNHVAAKWLLHPHQQFKRDLELQRNLWWVLGNNREVGRLTHEMSPWIDKTKENPYLVLRPIRYLSLTILLCWETVRQIPFAFKSILSVFINIPSAFKNITSAFKSIPSTIRNTPTAFKNILSSFKTLLSPFRKFVANFIGPDRTMDPEAARQGFQAAKENFVKALADKFDQMEVLADMQEALDCWESPYLQNSETWLERLKLLLWGYEGLRKQLRELAEERQKMVGPSASSGSPEYLLAKHEGDSVWRRRPVEMYYRPRPTEVHKEMEFVLMDPQRPPQRAEGQAAGA